MIDYKVAHDFLVVKIGEMFHACREQKGLSLRDIYSTEKVSMAVVGDLENGNKFPRFETLMKLMVAVDMPLESVFNSEILPKDSEVKNCRMTLFNSDNKYTGIRELFMAHGYNSKEIDDIIKYAEFLKHKRS